MLITKAELARRAGVSRPAIARATREGGPLHGALDGKRINADHHLIIDYLDAKAASGIPHKPAAPASGNKKTAQEKTVKARTAPKKSGASNPADSLESDPLQPICDAVGMDVAEYEKLTMRQIVMQYGTMPAFKQHVAAAKDIAQFRKAELDTQIKRGDVVDRLAVRMAIMSLHEAAFSGVVKDAPEALTEKLIARVLAGGPDLRDDVKRMLRDRLGATLKKTKATTLRRLRDMTISVPGDDGIHPNG